MTGIDSSSKHDWVTASVLLLTGLLLLLLLLARTTEERVVTSIGMAVCGIRASWLVIMQGRRWRK